MGRGPPSLFFIEIINRSFEESWKISPSVTEEMLMRAGFVGTVSVHALWMLFCAFHISRGISNVLDAWICSRVTPTAA